MRKLSRAPESTSDLSTVSTAVEAVDRFMRPSLTQTILEMVGEAGIEALELCEAIIIAGYGASSFRIERIQERLREERLKNKGVARAEKQYLRNYQKLIYKLKSQGLLKVEEHGEKSFFSMTAKGKLRLAALDVRLKNRLPVITYSPSKSERPVIVSFDIPEKLRSKRDWVREVLKHLGLRMVHQSVWIGMMKIPKELLDDLREMNLLEYIEIFEVGKMGTLKHIA